MRTLTRPALLVSTAVLAALAPALASPVRAADPPGSTEVAVTHVIGGGFAFEQLVAFATPDGPRQQIASIFLQLLDLEASRDGSRLVSVREDDGEFLQVRNISGDVVLSRYLDWDGLRRSAVLSPNGSSVAYEDDTVASVANARPPFVQRVVDVATGAGTSFPITGTAGDKEFVTEDLLLIEEPVVASNPEVMRFRTVSLSGRPVAVSGITDSAGYDLSQLAFDPTGTKLAFVRTPTGGGASTIEVAPVTLTASALTVGAPVAVTSGAVTSPAFTRDGARVAFSAPGASGGGDLFTVPVSGGAPALLGPATSDRSEPAVVIGTKVVASPGSVTLGPAELNGNEVRIPTLSAPSDGVVRVVRRSAGLPDETVDLAAGSVYRSFGLDVGRTYTFTAQLRDRSGNAGPVSEPLQLVATAAPAVTVPTRGSDVSTTTSFPVAVTGGTRYDIDYRDQAVPTWTRWVTGGAASSYVFGSPASAGQAATSSVPSRSYVFRVRSYDAFGNTTVFTTSTRAVVPLDQDRGTRAGSTLTVARAGAWGGNTVFLRAARASTTLRMVGDRFEVIGEAGPTAGVFDVFLDGVLQARVDSRRAVRTPRAVLWSKAFVTKRNQVMTVRAVGTTGRPTVVVDAFTARAVAAPGPSELRSGSQLLRGQRLRSANGHVAELRASDGRFVTFGPVGGLISATPPGATRVALSVNGNLVAYDPANRVLFQSGTAGNGASTLVMQDDGNLALYRDRDGRVTWTSKRGRL